MTKITDLEADINQFKTTTGDRFDRLEQSVESLRVEAENYRAEAETRHQALLAEAAQRHDDLLAFIAAQFRAAHLPGQPTGPSQPPPCAPANSAITSAPPSISASTPPSATTLPLAIHTTANRPPVTNIIPPSATLPYASIPQISNNDIPPPFSYAYTTLTTTTTPPDQAMSTTHHSDGSYIHPSQPAHNRTVPPSNTYIVDPGPIVGDSDHGHGTGPPNNRTWIPGPEYRLRKLKMPLFDGTDAFGWVFRLERYFDIQGLVTSGERLRAAVICMEGQALSWYRWADNRMPFRTWESLKQQLLDRFQPSHEGDIYEQFLAIQQNGTVREYISSFESFAAQLVGIPERVMEGTFIKGLKPEIRSSVRMLQPIGLTQTIKTALLADEGHVNLAADRARELARVAPLPPLVDLSGPKPAMEATKPVLKRMTEAEILERRAKGLCFKCNGRFGPGHRCPDKTLQVLLIDEGEEAFEGEEEPGGRHHAD